MSVHADQPPPLVSDPHGLQYATGPQIGKGGFAICHRAELLQKKKPTGQIVALKIVRSKMEPPKLAQKFVTELQIHSKLHHPNIVDFYRAFAFESSTYVVLEIAENGSLADALKKRKSFSMPEIRRFLIQTCGAVKYLHHRNIVHRDLKTGNLFLDKHMNIKVGDFGLAAVLLTQNDIGARRTTMCGTPNYLAPEILEKGGKGHNEKVDLWAIGIIAYTLAVGRAPFHAAKREEIYKKLQMRDYRWPEPNKTTNDISNDLRDLVGSLLVHEDDRPSPDQIASHAFFKMAFCPLQLDANCINRPPVFNVPLPTLETKKRGYSDTWYRLCKEAGVGEISAGKSFPIIGGGRKMRSVVRDCEKEVAAGRQPIVPMPANTVYLPFPDNQNWPHPNVDVMSEIAEEKESSAEGRGLSEATGNKVGRQPPRRPANTTRKVSSKENQNPSSEEPEPVPDARPQRTRSVRKVGDGDEPHVQSQATRTRRQPSGPQAQGTLPPSKKTEPAVMVKEIGAPKSGLQPRVAQMPAARPSGPAISHTRKPSIRQVQSTETEPVRTQEERQDAPHPQTSQIDPTPLAEAGLVPSTDPASVLARVSKFRDGIVQALENKGNTIRRASRPVQLPYVTKWVDYSRKHGLGYVLEDGSIGCLMTSTSKHPVTAVVVREGVDHLRALGQDTAYLDKVPFEHYSCNNENGIKRIALERDRKRATGILWAKFGRYMCQQLGQQEKLEPEADRKRRHLVRFYQRLGDVVLWGFWDGSFQFNFPDHTKLVLSPHGNYCTFTCLTLDAVNYLQRHNTLPFRYIKDRQQISCSLVALLMGSQNEPNVEKTMEGNLLKDKLRFVVELVEQWIAGGGLGCKPEGASYVKWDGPRLEDGKKEEWVTVGRFGGDGERE